MKGGAKFFIRINTACTYRFNFNTTKGCTEDKDRQLKPDDMGDGQTRLYLDKDCGTLKAKFRPIGDGDFAARRGRLGSRAIIRIGADNQMPGDA